MPEINLLNPHMLTLCFKDVNFAKLIAENRHAQPGIPFRGPHNPDIPPPEKKPYMLRQELVGAMAEIAVCRYTHHDPHDQPHDWWGRPGMLPDLVLWGTMTVSVKGTEYWHAPLHLFQPVLDPSGYAFLLSVDTRTAKCGIHGFMRRTELPDYELDGKCWKVPAQKLHPAEEIEARRERDTDRWSQISLGIA